MNAHFTVRIPPGAGKGWAPRQRVVDRLCFVLHPGFVRSKNDGQTHYVTAAMLRHVYGLDRFKGARVIVQYPGDRFGHTPQGHHLYPREDGRYEPFKMPPPPAHLD